MRFSARAIFLSAVTCGWFWFGPQLPRTAAAQSNGIPGLPPENGAPGVIDNGAPACCTCPSMPGFGRWISRSV